ncbi:hypothetical protein B296_00037640 [Ensete ventricosum]|uniref:Uncharacterized protein n=1 Tax=Ensete ventricosum TaxID=4639 RepID=A0A426ZYY2_ENSVE|nr:hypothetical protein B296_00037640 [Ensete ventricosum]
MKARVAVEEEEGVAVRQPARRGCDNRWWQRICRRLIANKERAEARLHANEEQRRDCRRRRADCGGDSNEGKERQTLSWERRAANGGKSHKEQTMQRQERKEQWQWTIDGCYRKLQGVWNHRQWRLRQKHDCDRGKKKQGKQLSLRLQRAGRRRSTTGPILLARLTTERRQATTRLVEEEDRSCYDCLGSADGGKSRRMQRQGRRRRQRPTEGGSNGWRPKLTDTEEEMPQDKDHLEQLL